MRIIINIEEGRDKRGKRAVCVRTGYSYNADDPLRVMSCGTEIYELIKEGFADGFTGGVIIHEGERK